MSLALLPRIARIILALACLLAPTAGAQVRHILDLDVRTQPAQLLDWGDYWIDPTGHLSLQAVLASPGQFRPTIARGQYPLEPGQALWIRFTVPATPDDQRWYVRLPQPGLDLASLYTLGADDAWTVQRAGDSLPVSQWALPHNHPVLPLAVSAAEPTRYMLRIDATSPFGGTIDFVSESRLSWEQQRTALAYGVYFGLLVTGAVFALATGVVLRDAAYLWFGLWSAAAMLSAATSVGVGGMHFWPQSTAWADAAHYALPASTAVPFLFFLGHVLMLRERAVRLFAVVVLLAGVSAACAFAAGVLPAPWRLHARTGSVAVAAATAAVLVPWSWHRGDRFARNLLLALVPLAAALPLQLGTLFDLPPLGTLPASVPLTALAVSLCGTYLLLTLRSQERRDHRRRIAQLHEFDPTTGLVNDAMFSRRLQELIERARRFDHHSVAAIVDFTNLGSLREEFGRKHALELLLRLAERLTSMMRSMDTVARLGDSRFGLLVDGPVGASRAKALCAKVVAHCITPLSGLPQGMVVRPKIALVLVPMQGGSSAEVLHTLDSLLREAAGDRTRVILMPPLPVDDSRGFPASDPTPAPAPPGAPETSTTNFPSTVTSADPEAESVFSRARPPWADAARGPLPDPVGFDSFPPSDLPSSPASDPDEDAGISAPARDSPPR